MISDCVSRGREASSFRQKDILEQVSGSRLNFLSRPFSPIWEIRHQLKQDMNFMLRLRGREQRLLKKIDEALERIENGTFGI